MIYLTTDTHFGHGNIKNLCGRPENFEELLIKGFEILTKDDVLIHLGDVAFTDQEKWNKVITSLPCKTWLLKGNHDKKSMDWYLSKGWDFVGEWINIKYKGEWAHLRHEPLKGIFHICIHGHLHNTSHHGDGFENNIKLSVEENNYKLWRLDLVLKQFNKHSKREV